METVSINALSVWLKNQEDIAVRFAARAERRADKHHAEGRAKAFEEARLYLLSKKGSAT